MHGLAFPPSCRHACTLQAWDSREFLLDSLLEQPLRFACLQWNPPYSIIIPGAGSSQQLVAGWLAFSLTSGPPWQWHRPSMTWARRRVRSDAQICREGGRGLERPGTSLMGLIGGSHSRMHHVCTGRPAGLPVTASRCGGYRPACLPVSGPPLLPCPDLLIDAWQIDPWMDG